jgi:hypothetical protein
MIAGPHGLAFEVLEADPRRLKRVRILPAVERLSASEATAALPAASGPGPRSSAA